MQALLHRPRAALAVAAIALLSLAAASPASAGVRRLPLLSEHGRVLVFGVKGLRPASIRSARVQAFGHTLRLRPAAVRAALRRGGRLRVVVPRSWARHRTRVARHRRRNHHATPSAGSPAPAPTGTAAPAATAASTPTLIVVTGPPTAPPTGPAAPPMSVGALIPAVPANAYYLSPTGDDSAPGTAAQPWRTLQKAMSVLQPGDTVVLRGGTYGAPGVRTWWTASGTSSAPVTIMADPAGPRPTIKGYTTITGSDEHIYGLLFDGPTGQVIPPTSDDPGGEEVEIWSEAPGTVIAACEIRNSHWHAGIYLTHADNVQLIGNYIHDNGNFSDPAQANLDHGIYWGDGNGGLIADNLIVHNVAYGVHLYPDAHGVTVTQNTILSNGRSGVIVSDTSSNNLVVNNIVAYNATNSIRSDSLTGTGNVARDNIVWGNGSGNIGADADGLTLQNNVQADPHFVGGGDYHPAAGSPAIGRAEPGYSLPYDYTGAPRSTSGPTVGAFEAH
jgi:Right handed beta helix region